MSSRLRAVPGYIRGCLWILVFAVVMLVANRPAMCATAPPPGDPGGSVTGRDRDVLDSTGGALLSSDVWTRNQSREPLAAELANAIGQNRVAINIVWTLVCAFMVMFMQAGFALVETGLCRAKNAAHVFTMNFMVYPISALGFWAVGFGLMFGGMNGIGPSQLGGVRPLTGPDLWGFCGTTGFFLSVNFYDVGVFTMFLFQVVFMDTMTTIPTGAMAERWKFSAFIAFTLFGSMLLYPLYGHWVWGNGWLANLGSLGLGHGAVDFAGSGVVHGIGGGAALAGAWVLGPRHGRFNKDGSPVVIPGHNLPMALTGVFILAFGWFGFNSGSLLGASGGGALRIAIVAGNTMLASAAGAVCAMVYQWLVGGKPDPVICANGMLAGLVGVTAPCAFIDSVGAVITGGIAGVLMSVFVVLFERWHLDDPVGAVSVHWICGLWGLLAVGLFADGTFGIGWNGVGETSRYGVRGLFYGDAGQLGAQLISILVCVAWGVGASWLFFRIQHRWFGIRCPIDQEIRGLDIPELGTPAYPDQTAAA